MKKILFIDAYSGISGDMLVAAFIDAGMPLEFLEDNFKKLRLPEKFSLKYKMVKKGAISAGQFTIDLEPDPSHDLVNHHRHMSDIHTLINESDLSLSVKNKAIKVFEILAIAEGKIHGQNPDEVHFHEVGATDSILDIVGIALAYDYFNINEVYCSSLPWSEGEVSTQHGVMPLPAPATLMLLSDCKAVLRPFESSYELVTPTGAAFLATFAKFEKPLIKLQKQGIGAGFKDFPWPNILRILIGEGSQNQEIEYVMVETNIDDMNPQIYGHLLEKCFNAGAVDVFFESIYMKKNRPATKVSIIVAKPLEAEIANLLLKETTTYGVRVYPVWRYEAERDSITVQSRWGEVRVKRKWLNDAVIQYSPEYEDCKRIAEVNDLSIINVIEHIKHICHSD